MQNFTARNFMILSATKFGVKFCPFGRRWNFAMVVCKQNFTTTVRHENKIYSTGRQILALFCVARGFARADEILRDKRSKISTP
ncbi:hypothetical protein [uncultured Campylobacter sp.]|uniref:hypothetical protein n=1 Tax=uncultured Campylobacter sp. TaxID=218934 RepID=UPI002620B415|nr:hypothetical protein [uncultured Campylobacter sp.]